ncbi:tyrosinase family oxidase copper chaperone [Streptomyces beihaiensis]|uniref:Tyrosinase cofactor n=1 Tax=Streptomyces beihaiensis TaxID=2984495 RepID=A0ABT3TQX9_9ACTN|nr:tyrosinase family oxidase copper chaperone [Streptomyces beihaiensis]MCX3059439.1 tyrosinase cofactor [Streptomyces beihaiensis]
MNPNASVTGAAPGGARPLLTRRTLALLLLGGAAGTTATFALRTAVTGSEGRAPTAAGGAAAAAFDETYLGRRIVGAAVPGSEVDGTPAWRVTVDGRRLHLMRRADGTYMSMVDHYATYPTALAATRAAVEEIGHQALRARI